MHKKTKILPLPAGKGVGGMGARTKLKAAGAGDKEGKPPTGHHSGRGRAGNAGGKPPRKVPAWQAL